MRAESLLRRAALAAAALAAAGAAFGYDIIRAGSPTRIVRWPAGNVTFQVKVGSSRTLIDGSNFTTSFGAAISAWNAVIANVQLVGNAAAEGPGGENNGLNEVFFAADIYGEAFGESTLAVTTSFRSSAVRPDGTFARTQSDIIFNNARTGDSYRGARRSGITDFQRVAIHELGHSLGLDHPDEAGQTVSAIMNSRVSDIDALRQDDIDGAQFLYGSPGTVTRPANNDFANAAAVTLATTAIPYTARITASSVNANRESGEPNHAPNETGGASVWWRWTAPANGRLTVTTAGSNFDTLLGIYTGSAVGSLNQLGANDDSVTPEQDSSATRPRTSIVTLNAITNGTTYFFAVDGWQGEWGSIVLNVDFIPELPPVISTHPQSQSVLTGAAVTFSVTASGSGTLSYQWLRNGTAIAGATSASLALTNVQVADAGTYTVRVTNANGSVTSNGATLTVTVPSAPTFTTQPVGVTTTVGSSLSLTAAANGVPAPTYQWRRNGTDIAGATAATFNVASAQTSDSGTYTAVATNSVGSATSTAVTVSVNPVVVPPPSSGGGGGGGGGSPSLAFAGLAAAALLARALRRRG
jgi:hypothetical protein